MRLNPFAPTDNPLYESLYCFGSDDNGDSGGGSAGDFEGTNFGGDTAKAGGSLSGRSGSVGSDNDRMVTSSGNTQNFNIDYSQPSVTADIGGETKTVYGSQANLDKAISEGDISVTPNPSDTYTPGTQGAAQAYGAEIADQEDALGFAPGAAAGPALANVDTTDPFQTMQFGTPVTEQAFSPVTRAMSPFEMALAGSLGSKSDFDPEVQKALRGADRTGSLISPQQTMSPVDAVNIFDQFEQPIGANNPPTALDPSRPMTQIRAATPADLITAEARAAANQLFGPDRTRPTAAEVAAADQRLTSRTPGLQAAINEGIMPANIEGQYGMQPTTTEVDAYNAAINAEIADQLGVDTYNPVTYGVNPTDQITQVSTGPITQQDYANLAAGRGAIQGDMGIINQAAQEVALETGVSPQVAAQATGIVGANPELSATVLGTGSAYPSGQEVLTAEEQRAMAEADRYAGAAGFVNEYMNQNASIDQALADFNAGDYGLGDPSRDFPTGGGLVSEPVQAEDTRAAEQQADADQYMDVSAIDVTRPTNQELVAQGLRSAGLSESAIQRGIAPEGTLPGDEEQGAFLGENIVRDPRAQFKNPLANVPYLSTVGEIGTGIANSLFRSTAQVDDMIDKGAQEITDENGFRIGAFDPRSKTVYSVAGESFNPALEPYYAQQREAQAAQAESGGGGDAQDSAPVKEIPEEAPPGEYVGKQIVKPYQYQPRGPLSYAYTGLPSLAPQKLRPSYRAPKTFSPLFPVS